MVLALKTEGREVKLKPSFFLAAKCLTWGKGGGSSGEKKAGKILGPKGRGPSCLAKDLGEMKNQHGTDFDVRDPGSNSSFQVNNYLTLGKLFNLVLFFLKRHLRYPLLL